MSSARDASDPTRHREPAGATPAGNRRVPAWPVREPECPPGWRTGPPDFVGIGAHRSGTTWLYQLLIAHPDVAVPPGRPKEIHFFQGFWEGGFTPADVSRYHRYFPRPEGKLAGEWTPRYMFDTWTPRMLAAAAPDARLIVLLRDPVARYVSHLATHLGKGPERVSRGPAVASIALARSLYMAQLRAVLAHFPREQLLVLQSERCTRQPERELRRAYDFLDLDPSYPPPDPSERINVGGTIDLEAELLEDLTTVLAPDAAELAREFPEIDPTLWPTLSRGA